MKLLHFVWRSGCCSCVSRPHIHARQRANYVQRRQVSQVEGSGQVDSWGYSTFCLVTSFMVFGSCFIAQHSAYSYVVVSACVCVCVCVWALQVKAFLLIQFHYKVM